MHIRNAIYCVFATVTLSALLLSSAPVTAMSAMTGIGGVLDPSETQGDFTIGEYRGPILTQQNMADIDSDGDVDILGSENIGNTYRGGTSGVKPVSNTDSSSGKVVSLGTLRQAPKDKSKSNGTKILFDQAHGNISIGVGGYNYSSFVASLTSNGYTVDTLTSTVTLEALQQDGLFVIPSLWNNYPNTVYYYTSSEIAALQTYVQQGGSLFLICDYGGNVPGLHFNAAEGDLSAAFGVTLDADIATDPTDYIEEYTDWITFHQRNFANHPIMQGISSLQSFATATMSGSGISLITTDPDATPANKSVALALNYGNGKVVIVGDSNYFGESGGSFINYEDNRQFGLNIVSWLLASGVAFDKFVYLPLILRYYP